MSGFEVDALKYIEWANKSIARVRRMKDTFYKISAIIEVYTRPLVPLERGYLENSFEERIVMNEPFYEMQVIYSGKENPYARGYDYAYVQHIGDFNHPLRGEQLYLKKGIERSFNEIVVVLETDYLTALGV